MLFTERPVQGQTHQQMLVAPLPGLEKILHKERPRRGGQRSTRQNETTSTLTVIKIEVPLS